MLQLLSLHRYHHRAYCDIIHLPLTLPPDLMTQRSSQPQKLENSLTSHACFPLLYQQINFDKLRTHLAISMNISLCNAPANCTWINNRTTNWLSFPEGKIPWLGGDTLPPRNEQVPVTECPLKPCARSCYTVQGLYDLAGMVIFVDCLICSKGGGILYQLALQLWILYFLVTVH